MTEQKEKANIQSTRKRSGRTLLRIIVFFFLLILSLPILIHIGPVQKFIVNRISAKVESTTGSNLDIRKVNFSVLKGVILEDIFISEVESPSDTLAFIGELSSSLEENILSLLNNRVHIKDINLFEARIHIDESIEAERSNLDEFLLRLGVGSSNNQPSSGKAFDLNLRNINLRNLELSMDNAKKQSHFYASLKEGHIGIEKLLIDQDSFSIKQHFSFKTGSGYCRTHE